MKRFHLLLILSFLFIIQNLWAQQTVGLFQNSSFAEEGYTLFAPVNSTETYLIDNCGEKIHSWSSIYRPGLSVYLLEDGTLLRTGRIQGMGNGSGIVEMIDWDGNVFWSYSAMATHGRQHHDIELLPNGNILLIVWDQRSQDELIAAGTTTNNNFINSEQIIEIEPDYVNGGASVVWEWKAWDHLVQDTDTDKPFYGTIAEHPERIDVNFVPHIDMDWLHINGMDYKEEFDQIILSVHGFSELWVIDHSTNTQEASSSIGGNYGKGGDLLYRWGNPQAYNQGTEGDRKLFLQHDTQWIPDGYAGEGKIILFNNQAGTPSNQNYSTVNIIDLPINDDGSFIYNGAPYGPDDFDWTYQAPIPTDFFSNIISGVQRLPNGNTLICEGVGGRFFEVDPQGEMVWEYINPVIMSGPLDQGDDIEGNNVFRCTRYSPDYIGFQGQLLSPQGYIESGSTYDCFPEDGDCDPAVVFANETTNAVCFQEIDAVRKVYSNNIPGHEYGPFGGMNNLEAQDFEYDMCLYPELGDEITQISEDPLSPGCGNGIIFGVSKQGVNYSPFARIYWVNPNTQEENLDWHVEADHILAMDLNGGHVNAASRYHYHNIALDYFIDDLGIEGTEHSPVVGYAADGFPIYYKYLYSDGADSSSAIVEFESSYALKEGLRPGDGILAPDGTYDGTYIEDYEYTDGLSSLDECGMRFAKTPEYPEGTFYYVLTDNWPYIPRCLKGKYVDNSFRLGQSCPASTAFEDCSLISKSVELEGAEALSIQLFPNPVSAYFSIQTADGFALEEIQKLLIYSSDAKLVYSSSAVSFPIYIENLPSGLYFVQFDLGEEQFTKKLIIK